MTATHKAYANAVAAAGLPDWLRWEVEVKPRRKTVGLIVEPGIVTFTMPPTATGKDLTAAARRKLPLVLTAAQAPGPDDSRWGEFFDVAILHTSGGKDSEPAMRHALAKLAAAGVLDRTAVLHLVLDKEVADEPRIEWQQVPELAAEQAARAGIPLAAEDGWGVWNAHLAKTALTDRAQWVGLMHYARRDFDGDLLDDFATRRKRDGAPRGWATMWTRYCTSEWKTAVGRAFTEFICEQVRAELGLSRPVRVLQVMGFRAEESDERADRRPFSFNFNVTAEASRHVWEWLPIHKMTKCEVWADIRAAGVPYHPVYDEGMTRLSCRHCIMASRPDLAQSKRLSPASAVAYMRVEARLNDAFQQNRPLASIEPAPGPVGFDVWWTTCPACGVRVLASTRETERYCPRHAETGPWDRAVLRDGPPCGGQDAPIEMSPQLALFGTEEVA